VENGPSFIARGRALYEGSFNVLRCLVWAVVQ
jgi:hypothetical protein